MRMDRRRALKWLGLGAVSPAALSPVVASPSEAPSSFRHGVAAGDPTPSGMIIWTRVTPRPNAGTRAVLVAWTVAEDPDFRKVAARGVAFAGPERDFTVKIDVGAGRPGADHSVSMLRAGTEYWYRFRVGDEASPPGRARTLPEGPTADAVLAVVCCQHYQYGLFNAYDAIARLPRLDAVVHLGDYIYEDAADASAHAEALGDRLGRFVEPRHATVTLADYRARHAVYKTDPDLQAAHARAAWICAWDDHETANDSWFGGAEKHHPATDGRWSDRKAAALRAYYEWMPIREPAPGRAIESINRTVQFGDLASLIMLETRLVARSHQLDYQRDMTFRTGADGRPVPDIEGFMARLDDPSREVLGARQEAWLAGELSASLAAGRPWQVLGSGVVMGRVIGPDLKGMLGATLSEAVLDVLPEDQRTRASTMADLFAYGVPYDLDDWDGYPAARERLYAICRAAGARPVVISGDSHAFWANDLHDAEARPVGVEFGATSITSPGICDIAPVLPVNQLIEDANPHVKFCDHGAKGFVLLTLTREAAVGELMAVSTIQAKPYGVRALKRFRVDAKGGGLRELTEV